MSRNANKRRPQTICGKRQRPVHTEIPAGFAHWRRQHHKQLIGFRVAVQAVANIGAGKHRVWLAAVQRAIQLLFDGRAQQQRKLRVIHAQMQAQASRRRHGARALAAAGTTPASVPHAVRAVACAASTVPWPARPHVLAIAGAVA